MMLNLFMVFDPYMKILPLNWISSCLSLIFIPQLYWIKNSMIIMFFNEITLTLYKEFKLILKNNFNLNNLLYFFVLFMFIMFNNFMGLYPYIFTSTSHLSFCLLFSFSMWLSLMFFGWINNMNFMFAHLVPLGTPFSLMFFMVFIETLSNFIRSFTLAIRLMANMMAGHLLLTLLGSFIPSFILNYLFILFMQILLMLLEISVSMIQSYVYIILLILYLKETN